MTGSRSRRSEAPSRSSRGARPVRRPARGHDARVTATGVASEPSDLPSGAGPLWVGGMASCRTRPGGCGLVVAAAGPADDARGPARRLRGPPSAHRLRSSRARRSIRPTCAQAAAARLGSLRDGPFRRLDPQPARPDRGPAPPAPAATSALVADAVERIRARRVDKLVLAREVTVTAPAAHSPAALFGALREPSARASASASGPRGAPSSAPAPSSSSGAAAPSRRRSPSRVRPGAAPTRQSTTTSASSCCAARRTATSTRSSSGGSSAAGPALGLGRGRAGAGRDQGRQHPAPGDADPRPARRVPLRARARRAPPPDAGRRAPSRAGRARALIAELEGIDRGWYAGPRRLDGRRRGRRVLRRPALGAAARPRPPICSPARASSPTRDPAAELAETEIKLGALLPLLAA